MEIINIASIKHQTDTNITEFGARTVDGRLELYRHSWSWNPDDLIVTIGAAEDAPEKTLQE